uniref:CSON005914 protein n=1 Tax=Culicoides sonorensis TaxID=179676 RepID=A0A336MVC7_CULSO
MEINNTTGFYIISTFNVALNDLQICFIAIEIIIGLVTVLGSSIVLALYYHERKSPKISYKYFTAMAIGDLIQGFVTPTICIYFSFGVTVSDPFCFESVVIGVTAVFVSMLLMLAMSIDRYFAIMKPMEYKSRVTPEMTYGIIFACVFGGLAGGAATALSRKEPNNPNALCFVFTEYIKVGFNATFLGAIVTPCLIIFVYSYVKIYKVILDALEVALILIIMTIK